MKAIIFLMLTFYLVMISAQERKKAALEVAIGRTFFNNTFNVDLPNLDKGIKVGAPYSVSVFMNNYRLLFTRSFSLENVSMSFTQVIPSQISIDSNKVKLSGFTFRQHACVDLFNKGKWIALNVSVGYAAGRTNLFGDKSLSQKNQFFKPEIGIQPRFFIKKLVFSFNAFYGLDISSSIWKKKWLNNTLPKLITPFRQGGLYLSVSVGLLAKYTTIASGGSR